MGPWKIRKRGVLVAIASLAVVAVVAFLAAGCGSSTTTTTAPPTTAGATTTAGASTTAGGGASTTTSQASSPTTAAALSANLNGAGSTFVAPVLVEWIGAFQKIQPGVKINYQGVGSGAGIQQFTAQTVDFGASDAFMKPDEISAAEAARPGAKVIQIPVIFGSITIAYNLSGVSKLQLDSTTLANIFLGKIKNWNDPAITALNPGVNLPSTPIQTVHRSDSSGTTNGFTSYLAEVNADWKAGPGAGKTVKWPTGVGGQGNDGVAAVIKQTPGSIGYIELAHAVTNNIPVAAIKNKSGAFITPSLESTSAAAEGIQIPADFNLLPLVSDSANPKAYPIITQTYILAYDKMPDPAKAAALKAFVTWALTDGGSIAQQLGYATVPSALRDAALTALNAIGS